MRQPVTALFRNNANLIRRRVVPGYRYKSGASGPFGPDMAPGGILVGEGDSLTYGTGATPGVDGYPEQLITLLGAGYSLTSNHGTAGDKISDCDGDWATVNAFRDVNQPNNFLLWWCGSNDLITADTAATIETAWINYVDRAILAGWTVIALTFLPRYELTDIPAQEAKRIEVNQYLRDQMDAHNYYLADVAGDSRIGDAGDEQDLTYYANDGGIHMNATGYGIVAGIVQGVIQGLFSS